MMTAEMISPKQLYVILDRIADVKLYASVDVIFPKTKLITDFKSYFEVNKSKSDQELLSEQLLKHDVITKEDRIFGNVFTSKNRVFRTDKVKINGETLLHKALALSETKDEQEEEKESEKVKENETEDDVMTEIINVLIKYCPKMITYSRDDAEFKGLTPLHMAVLKRQTATVKKMITRLEEHYPKYLSQQLNVCADGSMFRGTVIMAGTPLGIAALGLHKDMYKLLARNGAGLDEPNILGDTIFHSLVRHTRRNPEKLKQICNMIMYINECRWVYMIDKTTENEKENKQKQLLTDENEKERKEFEENKQTENEKKRKEKEENKQKQINETHKLWMLRNKDELNPLQLAVKLEQYHLFEFIMSLEVYCEKDASDGLFDSKEYDISEIDTLPVRPTKKPEYPDASSTRSRRFKDVEGIEDETLVVKEDTHRSILEYVLNHNANSAFMFINFQPVREVINLKWMYYQWVFLVWSMLHFGFITVLSVGAAERSYIDTSSSNSSSQTQVQFSRRIPGDTFVTAVGILSLIIAAMYFIIEIRRLSGNKFSLKSAPSRMYHMLNLIRNPYSNVMFRCFFVLFGILLVVDFICAIVAPHYENYCLPFAVIAGWYLMLFFLQLWKPFSFFTVLIQRVLADLIKFAIVMTGLLVAFSVSMFMVMQGSNTQDDSFDTLGRTIIKMLMVMLGIGELGVLFEARHPAMAITLFVLFVLLTTILLLNALIAMMSNTCTELMSDQGNILAREMHYRLQKLSAIFFIESVLPSGMCKEVGETKPRKRFVNGKWHTFTDRRMLSSQSIHKHEESGKEHNFHPSRLDTFYELGLKKKGIKVRKHRKRDRQTGKVTPNDDSKVTLEIIPAYANGNEVNNADLSIDNIAEVNAEITVNRCSHCNYPLQADTHQ